MFVISRITESVVKVLKKKKVKITEKGNSEMPFRMLLFERANMDARGHSNIDVN